MKGKNAKTVKWIYDRSKKQFGIMGIISLMGIISSLCGIFTALVTRNIFDIATGSMQGDIILCGVVIMTILIFQLALTLICNRLSVLSHGKIENDMRRNMLLGMTKTRFDSISTYHTGELLNRLINDAGVVSAGITTLLPSGVSIVASLVAGIWVMFSISQKLTALLLLMAVVLFSARRIFAGKLKSMHKECQQSDGKIRAYFTEVLSNIMIVKAFGGQKTIGEKTDILQNKFLKAKLRRNRFTNAVSGAAFVLFSLTYFVAMIWGAIGIYNGVLTVGTLTAFLYIITLVQTPIRNISTLVTQYYAMIASAERLIEMENLQKDGEKKNIQGKPLKLLVSDLCFAYQNEEPCVKKLSFEVSAGEIVGIKGPSGIGKTTIFKLLMGFYKPSSGEMILSMEDGKQIPVDETTREIFSFVPQGDFVFSGTLKENILFGKEVSSERLSEILDIVALSDFKDKTDETVGERGIGLSEGQLQRLAIARGIAFDRSILLLDEFTSALDTETEKIVLGRLRESGKTCIIISHKESTLACCDKVVEIV